MSWTYKKLQRQQIPSPDFNNNRELIERFWNLKALYNLKQKTYNAQIPIIMQINSIQM